MNKVTLSPFDVPHPNFSKEGNPTPRLLIKKKKTNSYIHNLAMDRKESCDDEERIDFDDTFCFREFNQQIMSNNLSLEKEKPANKCQSQIMAVKLLNYSGSKVNQTVPFQCSSLKQPFRIVNMHRFDSFRVQNESDLSTDKKMKRNYTSQSPRKRNHGCQQQNDPELQGSHFMSTRNDIGLSKSTLMPQRCVCRSEQASPMKQKSKTKAYFSASGEVSLKGGQRKDKSQGELKKANFLQYSIIKPDEIKSLVLLVRKEDKQLPDNKKYDQNAFYYEMMRDIKKKEEMMRKNFKLREGMSSQRIRQAERRQCIKTAGVSNRRNNNIIDEKNEVRPWEFQPMVNDII